MRASIGPTVEVVVAVIVDVDVIVVLGDAVAPTVHSRA
jgi:hypothetical protein